MTGNPYRRRGDGGPEFRRGRPAALCLAAFLAAFLAYLPTLRDDFVFDDNQQLPVLYREAHPQAPHPPPWAVWRQQARSSPYFRPLQYVAFAAGEALSGDRPWGYHLVLVLLNAACACLAGWVGFLLLGARAGPVAGVLFALYPAHVPSVCWVSETAPVLAALFVLLAFGLHLKRRPIASAAAWLAALLAHEGALFAPLLFFLHDLKRGPEDEEEEGRRFGRYVYFAAALALVLLLRFAARGAPHGGVGRVFYFDPAGLLALLGKMEAGLWLPPFHVDWVLARSLPITYAILGTACVAAPLVPGLWPGRRTALPYRILLWAVLPLLPLLLVRGGEEIQFARRYLYLSALAPCLAVAWGLERLAGMFSRERPATWVFWTTTGLAAALLLALVLAQSRVWKNSETLWTDAARRAPDFPMVRQGLATVRFAAGDLEGARSESQAALALFAKGRGDKKTAAEARHTLAMLERREGRPAEALRQLSEAELLDPANPFYPLWEGDVLSELGEFDKAVESYRKAAALAPRDETPALRLAVALLETACNAEAQRSLEEAMALNPEDPSPHYYMGVLLDLEGREKEARAAWAEYLKRARGVPGHEEWVEKARRRLMER